MADRAGKFRWSSGCLLALALCGCSSWEMNELASNLPSVGPVATLKHLESRGNNGLDRVQLLLDKGVLKFYVGDLSGAIEDLQQAKNLMQSKDATSITENIAAVTTNETIRSYKGSATDQTMVHMILALAYLFNNDLAGARVEMLQADLTMKQQGKSNSLLGQLAGAKFLAGVIYELNREYSDALIAYRQAYNIIKERGETVPEALQTALLRFTKRLGLAAEFSSLQQEFGNLNFQSTADKVDYLILYFDGVVSNKMEDRLSVLSGNTMVTIAVPTYPPNNYYPKRATLVTGAERQPTEIIENIERRAREDLDATKVKTIATATARAVTKNQFVQNSQEQSPLLGLVANVLTVVSEQADVRSWNMLPAAIQVARISVHPETPLSIPELGTQFATPTLEQNSDSLIVVWTSDLVTHHFIFPVNSPPPVGASYAIQP